MCDCTVLHATNLSGKFDSLRAYLSKIMYYCVIVWCLTLSAPWEKSWSLADGIDQDQTAQNMQSDLDLCCLLVKSEICGTIICGTQRILFTGIERGRFYISGAERVNAIV